MRFLKLNLHKKVRSNYKELIVVAAILFSFWMIEIGSIYGFLFFPDEFAYWASAARIAGYDWSGITSLGSYFSYGYGLVLLPVFVLCKDAIMAYRIAVGFNFVFLLTAFALLAGTMKQLASDKRIPVTLFSALAILVPWNLFYAQLTITEAFLSCLYILAGSILFCYLKNNRLSTLFLLMGVFMCLYMVHMRTIGILVSGMIVLLVHVLRHRERMRHLLIAIGMIGLFFAAASFFKEQTLLYVYGGQNLDLAAGNDYSGQIAKIQYIFTQKGMYDFMMILLGAVLYLGLATYGLFYWGMAELLGQFAVMYLNVKKRKEVTAEQKFSLFLLLSVISQIMISSIYLLTLGEVDDYTYGRYNELVVPFVMALGFTALWKKRARVIWSVTGILAVFQAAAAYLVGRQVVDTGASPFFGYFMIGISYLYDGQEFQANDFYAKALLFGELLTLFVVLMILVCRSNIRKQYIIMVFAVLQMVLAVRADRLYLDPFKKAAFRDSRLADQIEELWEDGKRIVYMDGDSRAFIGMLQFMARDVEIQVMEPREQISEYTDPITLNDVLIFSYKDKTAQEWAGKYANRNTYGHFTILYND